MPCIWTHNVRGDVQSVEDKPFPEDFKETIRTEFPELKPAIIQGASFDPGCSELEDVEAERAVRHDALACGAVECI